jgi:hypothetical protein
MSMRQSTSRTIWLTAIAALLVALGFRYLVATSGNYGPADLERFEQATGLKLPDWYERVPFLLTWSRGDGQIFLVLAGDPWLEDEATRILNIDYRLQRIGYSLTASAVVLGNPTLLPVGLLVVNAVAIVLIAALTARLAARDPRYWWLLANPGVLIGLVSDTAEPMGIALLVVALVGTTGITAGVAGSFLATVRPDFGLALGLAKKAGQAIAGWLVVAAGLTLAIASQVRASGWGGKNLTWPVLGYVEAWARHDWSGRFVLGAFAVAGLATIVFGLFLRGLPRASFVLSGIVTLAYSVIVLDQIVNLVRVSAALPVLWVFGVIAKRSQLTSPADEALSDHR